MDRERLARMARLQFGLVTRAQARACGFSTYQIARRLRAGEWQVVVGSALSVSGLRATASIRDRVVPLERYWMPDEAASVYEKARAVVSMECHSPIIALAQGTPAFYIQQPTDTWKGQMYPDLGLDDWKFEVDEATGAQIADRLLAVHHRFDEAKAKRDRALGQADRRYRETMGVVSGILKGT